MEEHVYTAIANHLGVAMKCAREGQLILAGRYAERAYAFLYSHHDPRTPIWNRHREAYKAVVHALHFAEEARL